MVLPFGKKDLAKSKIYRPISIIVLTLFVNFNKDDNSNNGHTRSNKLKNKRTII